MTILSTKHLTKSFGGINAVDHLSIDFKPGIITGIVGPNGSGKTTLTNLFTGVSEITNGNIVIKNTELRKIKPYDIFTYGMTRTFQIVRLFEQMTVLDNILVVLTERNVFSALFEKHKKFHLEQAENVLKKVGLWEKRNHLAVNLSYGQRKLLEIARAVATESDIYFFDEPFAGLFPEMVKTVISVLKELKEQEKTVILIEHNIEIIRELCDYLFVLDSGKLLAKGHPKEILERKDVIEAYLGE